MAAAVAKNLFYFFVLRAAVLVVTAGIGGRSAGKQLPGIRADRGTATKLIQYHLEATGKHIFLNGAARQIADVGLDADGF